MELFFESAEVLSLLAFLVGIKSCLLEFMVRYSAFQPIGDRPDTLFGFLYLRRRRSLTQLYQRSGGIQQFYRLSWQGTSREITSRGVRGKFQGFFRIGHPVKPLQPALASHEHAASTCLIERTDMNCAGVLCQPGDRLSWLSVAARIDGGDALHPGI